MTEVSSLMENAGDMLPPSHPVVPLARLLLVGRQVQPPNYYNASPSIPKAIECRQRDSSSSSSLLDHHVQEESWNDGSKWCRRSNSNGTKQHRTTLSFVANEILVPLVMSVFLYKILYMITNDDDNNNNRRSVLKASTALALYQPQNFACTSSSSEQMFKKDGVSNSWGEKRRALSFCRHPAPGSTEEERPYPTEPHPLKHSIHRPFSNMTTIQCVKQQTFCLCNPKHHSKTRSPFPTIATSQSLLLVL